MPYIGSPSVQTTTQDFEELILTPVTWVNTKMSYKLFYFYPETNCSVKINGSDPIYLVAYQDLKILVDSTNHLEPISSFIVVEAGVDYTLIAGY